jgi:hypothetical protein
MAIYLEISLFILSICWIHVHLARKCTNGDSTFELNHVALFALQFLECTFLIQSWSKVAPVLQLSANSSVCYARLLCAIHLVCESCNRHKVSLSLTTIVCHPLNIGHHFKIFKKVSRWGGGILTTAFSSNVASGQSCLFSFSADSIGFHKWIFRWISGWHLCGHHTCGLSPSSPAIKPVWEQIRNHSPGAYVIMHLLTFSSAIIKEQYRKQF